MPPPRAAASHINVGAARAWGHARERAGGAYGDQPASGGRAAGDPRTPAPAGDRGPRFSDIDDPEDALAVYAIEIAIVLLLVPSCVNVAILVYARTATRQGEIAVRGALGASRRRSCGGCSSKR